MEREAERLAGDLDASLLGGDLEVRFSPLLSERDLDRLRDFLLDDFSLERLRDLRAALTLDELLERDFRVLLLEGL